MARWHVALASLLAAWIATFACGKGTLSAQTAGALAVVAGSATPTLPTASKPASADPVAPPLGLQSKPDVNIPITDTAPFEKGEDVLSLPSVLTKQWTPVREVPLESVVNRAYLRTRSRARHPLTLKQAIYLALRNNPAVKVARLDPVAAQEAVNMAWAEFDPDTQASVGYIENTTPAVSALQTFPETLPNGVVAPGLVFLTRQYEWNFGISKVLSTTNGLASLQLTNLYESTNAFIQTINPYYQPQLILSLSQPLLRNFGWKFATIGVRIAQSQQKRAQWVYKQALDDFVQRVADDYWNLVRAQENLKVAQEALKFNEDLVRQNTISLRVGTLAPIDVQEAQAAAETARANLYTAEANLDSARTTLRQDVMINPSNDFIPDNVEAVDNPNPNEPVETNDERAIEHAVLYRPVLHGLRQAIETYRLQEKFMENQLLPQFNLTGLLALTAEQGSVTCAPAFGLVVSNCVTGPPFPNLPGFRFPFQGGYGSALGDMFQVRFYEYSVFFTWSMQLDNATAKAAVSEARVAYEQQRMAYRDTLSQVVTEVESAITAVRADQQRVAATAAATAYARQALYNEQQRFKVGMATTHDLLQFEEQLVSAEGNQIQAEVDLEEAKIQLLRATGGLLSHYDIDFEVQDPSEEVPWYARF